MKRIDFNENWICKCLSRDEGEVAVTLPHDAMLLEPRTEESRGEGNIGWFLGGDYEYRKTFFAPKEWAEQEVLLEFEAVYRKAEVFLNGEKAAFRPYGYTNFYVETKGFLKYGEENEVRVIARNEDQPNSRWYSGTGLFRPAWLWVGEGPHIPVNGVKIRTLGIQPAQVEVKVETSCPGTIRFEILDGENLVVEKTAEMHGRQAKATITIPKAKLWSCEEPNLYTCRITFGSDVVEEHFGIRELKWNAQGGMTINGKRVIIRGACVHHDNGVLGACAFPEAEERKVRLHKENGYNALRSSHYPCSKAFLDACDRLGMLVMDEYVDHWYIHKTKYDYADYMPEWWHQDLRDMVDKDYNHPCVIMYSTGNEVSETAQPRGIALTGEMTQYLHSLDDSRPVTCGINIFFNFLSSIGLGVYSDDKAESEAAKAETKPENKGKKKAVGSEFYNTLATVAGDTFMKMGAATPPSDWKTRDAYAQMDIAGYNYGLFRYKKDLRKYPNRLILGSETFCKDAYAFWEVARDNNRIIGDFVWPGMDYMGETGLGVAEFPDYIMEDTAAPLASGGGRIDLIGKPKAEAAYTKVAFELEHGPRMAVIPVYEGKAPKVNGWLLTKAVESWSWRGCEGQKARVEVYARGAAVELLVNGKKVARKKISSKNCRTLFNIPYESGELTAVSYDRSGKEKGRQTMTTAGEDTTLRFLPEVTETEAGKLVFIRLEYTDGAGIWKPMEKHHLNISVENGTLAGLGTACPFKKGSFGGNEVDTYFGDALAVVRADGKGPVRITVKDERETYTLEIPCKA